MINSNKIKIIATVPVAMICEFLLLEAFLAPAIGKPKQNVSQETFSKNADDFGFTSSKTQNQEMPAFFKSKSKIKVLSFPEPAAHTFVGNESSQENFALNGAIIK